MRIQLSSKILFVAVAIASVACALLADVAFGGGAAPTVTSVSVPADGSYSAGQNLTFTVNYDNPVTVDTTGGTPSVPLTIGTGSVYATYQSGTGTSALVFRYTVQPGDTDTDGIAVGSSINLNGGTIVDQGDGVTPADPTLNSVAATVGVLVDTTAPTVSSVAVPANGTYAAGQNLDFTVHFSENVTVGGGIPRIALTIGSSNVNANYQSGSGTNALVFRYTVQAGDSDTDGITVGALSANGGTLQDAAGNDANLTLNSVGSTTSVLVDAVAAPAVTSVDVPAALLYHLGQQLTFVVHFSAAVTVTTAGGTPSLPLTIGSTLRNATYQSGTGTNALTFKYTVQSGDSDSDGIAVGSTLALNGGTIKDSSANDAVLALNSVAATSGITVDAVAPTIASVSLPADGSYAAGKNLDFTVHFSENVTVSTGGGIPSIQLTVGTATKSAAYQSGSGSKDIVFRYTIGSSDSDSDGLTVGSSIQLNGGTIDDAASNAAALTLPAGTATILVDTTAPAISQVTAPAAKTYKTGDNVDFQVVFSEKMTVSGTPRLTLTVGTKTVYAAYVSGSGTTLTFRYTVAAGDADTDGVSLSSAVDLNGGTLADLAGNASTLTLTPPKLTGVLVDGSNFGTTTTPPPPGKDGGTTTPPPGGKDTTPPSKPAKTTAKATRKGFLYVTFGRARDNKGVVGYVILKNGKKVKTTAATSFLLPLKLAANTRSMTVQFEAVDKAGNRSAPVTIVIRRPAAPKGTPKVAPAWAVKLAAWQATPKRKRHKRPATPKHLPVWYGKWYHWQHAALKVTVS